MTFAHLHLLLNHVPVIGVVLGAVLFGAALVRRDSTLVKTTLSLFVALAVVSLVVYLTGGQAEELVENLPGVSESIIETHEDAALVASIAMGILGTASLGALLVFRKRALPGWLTAASFAGALAVAGLMGWTANLGGQIRHTEIRAGAGNGGAGEAARDAEPAGRGGDR